MNNYLEFEAEAITIYCAQHARHGVLASLQQAGLLAVRGEKVLYINTVLSNRKLLAAKRLVVPEHTPEFSILNIEIGELASKMWDIRQAVRHNKITSVIINGWEYATDGYTAKEKVIFGFKGLISQFEIS